MLSKELARKYYQERIDSESYDDYTEEELRLQKERAKKLEEYGKKRRKEREMRAARKNSWLSFVTWGANMAKDDYDVVVLIEMIFGG